MFLTDQHLYDKVAPLYIKSWKSVTAFKSLLQVL